VWLLSVSPAAAVASRGRFRRFVLLIEAEEGGVNCFVFVDQRSTDRALCPEPEVGAVAARGEWGSLGRLDVVEEGAASVQGLVLGDRLGFRLKQVLQRVTADELGMKFRVGGAVRHEIEARRFAVYDGQEADLVEEDREALRTLAEAICMGFEHIAHGRGRRRGAGFGLEFGDDGPGSLNETRRRNTLLRSVAPSEHFDYYRLAGPFLSGTVTVTVCICDWLPAASVACTET